ncbi:AAA-domain-containing protein [Meredithblackwellia eburnea MCA 4105]
MVGRPATIAFVSLRNCLVNLPIQLQAQLEQRGITPQSLVVQLSFTTTTNSNGKKTSIQKKAYVGWTGMPSQVPSASQVVRGNGAASAGAAAGGSERVEIDPQFAAMIGGLAEGTIVYIELLRNLPTATSVSVTPLTADDWEILETNAEFVEMNLLNQVRSVQDAAIVGCWVGGTTLVRFVVDSTSPASSPAVLLTSDTELIVAPKSRNQPSAPTQKPHDLSSTPTVNGRHPPAPTVNGFAHATSDLERMVKRRTLRLLPRSYPLGIPTSPVDGIEEKEKEPIAYLSPDLYRLVKSVWGAGKGTVVLHSRPKGEGSSSENGRGREESGGQQQQPPQPNGVTVGSPSAGQAYGVVGPTGSSGRKSAEVRFKEGVNVPSGHLWISDRGRKDLGIEIGAGPFDLVRLGEPLSKKARLEREKEKEQHQANGVLSPKVNGIHSRPSLKSPPSHMRDLPSLASTSSISSSSSTSQPLAGVEAQLSTIKSHIIQALSAKQLLRMSGEKGAPASGVLVTGASGAGKTALVTQVVKELECDPRALTRSIYVDCSRYADERLPTLKGKMKEWFDESCWHSPTVVVLDNLDRMLAAEVEHADSFPAQHLTHTFLHACVPALNAHPVIILATSQSSASLHPLLSTTHLLGETVNLRGPSKTARRDIISSLVKRKVESSNLVVAPSLNFASVAAITEGYLPADLRDLVDRAVHQCAIKVSKGSTKADSDRQSLELTPDNFTAAQVDFVPLSLRDVKLQKSEVQWSDIGGLHETRRVLRETLEWPTKYGAIFASCPLRLRSGLLLYGYPGCGKTLLASAVAKECGLNFISVKGPEILNKYIGASEKSVRDLFERAQAAKPCILFFDEFDSIAPKRGHDSTGVTDRVVNQMLTQMDGAEGLDGVYVLAATSRPDLIDPALLRPGRLDKSLLCDMPSLEDRLEIMKACARKITLSPDVDLASYAAQSEGFSGADLQALVYNAHLDAIHTGLSASADDAVESPSSSSKFDSEPIEYTSFGGADSGKVLSRAEQATVNKRLELILTTLAAAQSKAGVTTSKAVEARAPTYVEDSHLRKSLKTTRPSVPPAELIRLRRIYSDFVSGRSANGLPSGEASDEVGGRSSLM